MQVLSNSFPLDVHPSEKGKTRGKWGHGQIFFGRCKVPPSIKRLSSFVLSDPMSKLRGPRHVIECPFGVFLDKITDCVDVSQGVGGFRMTLLRSQLKIVPTLLVVVVDSDAVAVQLAELVLGSGITWTRKVFVVGNRLGVISVSEQTHGQLGDRHVFVPKR